MRFFESRGLLILLFLYFKTAVSLKDVSSSVITLLEGEELFLKCKAVGLGIHLWYKDGKPIVSNSTNNYLLEAEPLIYSHEEKNYFSTLKLSVNRTKRLHTGSYKCNSDDSHVQNVFVYSSGIRLGDHSVIFEGPSEVYEGQAFQISCEMPTRDPPLWTINTSQPILEENNLGYIIDEGEIGPFRREVTLRVEHTQLYHEGEYRCSRNSRHFHYVNVIPAFIEVTDDEDDDDDDEDDTEDDDDDDDFDSPYEYKLKINETYIFNCTTSQDIYSSVTWYKNGVRIIERFDSNVEIAGRRLTIEEAQEDDAGEYMCIVEPQYVEKYIGEGRIFRLISPAKVVDLPNIVQKVKGDMLELHCKTEGYPEPKITWIIGNLLATSLTKKDKRISLHSITRASSTLIVRNLTVADGGLYTCRAENTIDPSVPQIDEESVYVHVRGK